MAKIMRNKMSPQQVQSNVKLLTGPLHFTGHVAIRCGTVHDQLRHENKGVSLADGLLSAIR